MGQAGDPEGRRAAGEMTPLLLIPGMMCDARMWGGLPALLHPRPVAHCLPTKAETMADLAALILRDAPDRFALAGLSMGGIVAMEVLRQAPERVERLALLDTNPRAELPEGQTRRAPPAVCVGGGGSGGAAARGGAPPPVARPARPPRPDRNAGRLSRSGTGADGRGRPTLPAGPPPADARLDAAIAACDHPARRTSAHIGKPRRHLRPSARLAAATAIGPPCRSPISKPVSPPVAKPSTAGAPCPRPSPPRSWAVRALT